MYKAIFHGLDGQVDPVIEIAENTDESLRVAAHSLMAQGYRLEKYKGTVRAEVYRGGVNLGGRDVTL